MLHQLALAVLPVLALAAPTPNLLQSRASCADYEVMVYPGAYDPSGVRMQSTVSGITSGLGGGSVFYTQYNAKTADEIAPNMSKGANELVAHVDAVHSTCPNTKFVLFGYSFGTFQIMQAVNNPSLPRGAISAVITYGSAYWLPNQPQNKGTATSGTSAHAGEVTLPAEYISVTQDWCDDKDYFCTGSIYSGPNDGHFSYQDGPAHSEAASFAVQRIKSDRSLLGLGSTVNQLTNGGLDAFNS